MQSNTFSRIINSSYIEPIKSFEDKLINILIIEDSENDTLLVLHELKKNGYTPISHRVETASSLKLSLSEHQWDIIISDHNIPGFNSASALSIVKSTDTDIPFIIVSGSIGEDLAVAAMKAGAHDYIMKGNLTRLVPAIEREIREYKSRCARRSAEATIRHMAFHDALTGLSNRTEFERRLQLAIDNIYNDKNKHALLYIDLDQFKIINDTCGHIAGDELLRQLVVILEQIIRGSDTLARLGGDEFGVLLESCPLDRAMLIAENLLNSIRNFRFSWNEKTFVVGASIGLVMISTTESTITEILSAADMACYTAKDLGRNQVHIYREDDIEQMQRRGDMQWVTRIQHALDNNRLQLYKQRISSLKTTNTSQEHYECLLRLEEIDGTINLPGSFIPAAERYNLMPTIDRWVINNIFSHLMQTHDYNAGPISNSICFINLSGASLSDKNIFSLIHDLLQESKLPPSMFCFEITETFAISNLSVAIDFIKEIRAEGCSFALDDFGSGFSSFSYLQTIPLDYLKIDGSFIRDMLTDPINSAIVESINRIGHVAGLKTIAEFVESKNTLVSLQKIGIDYAQGYAIHPPAPIKYH